MRFGPFAVEERLVRTVAISVVLIWGAVAYLHGLLRGMPAPALHGTGLAVVLLNAATFVLLGTGLWLGRPKDSPWRWAGISLLLASMGTSLSLYPIAPHGGGGYYFSMAALWALLMRIPARWGLGLGTATVVSVAALGEAAGHGPDYGLLAAFVGLTLGALASRQSVLAQEATRRAEAANAVLAERSHIAREIHDILAHSLSAQIVHLEGARLLLSRDGDRVQALDRVERARNLARSGLEETRRALATLRGEIREPKDVIAELAEEFYVGTGRPCDVQVTGAPRELTPQAGLAVVRTAQEALTNVRKHAPGARSHVTLRYLSDAVELEVSDTGGTEPVLEIEGGGYGLVGMRERAELIGGTLETGPEGRGFRVALRVPA
ncbi:sensor histidine kinase [Actinomadura napierensis]|uniref:histidine kinase n=1 Tax=Actinomadura napierensis TaxID=267854 RepID=A0ABN2YGK9_9ACTN